jgi:hypothetical protein
MTEQNFYQPARTNTLAIVSLVTSLIGISLAGIICGHIAMSQIKRTGEQGQGMALAGTIIGYVGMVLSVIAVIGLVAAAAAGAFNSGGF